MTLDAVHLDEVAAMAARIARSVDRTERNALVETVWEDWLDPLRDVECRVALEPLGEQRLRTVDLDEIALIDRPYPTSHGVDSGTINPTTFKNGIVLDVAHAAMASTPSALDLHRCRSIVTTLHADDVTVDVSADWQPYDDGHSRRLVHTVPQVDRDADVAVHSIALSLAESEHVRHHLDRVDDFLLLDGPLYPTDLFTWRARYPDLGELLAEATALSTIVENYLRVVETCLDRSVPIVGVVKNPRSRTVTDTLREKHRQGTGVDPTWRDDTAFFRQLLEREDPERQDRRTDVLTCTNWFLSRAGADGSFASDAEDPLGVGRERDPAEYEVTFCMVYDPRLDVCYRLEAPRALTADEDRRERVTRQLLSEIASERGPPAAIQRADHLARIDAREKAALQRRLAAELDSERVETYDEHRWSDAD
jgi:hypothetical protein